MILDLFSGIGGLSLGFKHSGFEVVGIEKSHGRAQVYRANVGRALAADVRRVDFSAFRDVEGIISGPPCRPYSYATPKARRGASHPEYGLDAEVVRATKALRPLFVVIEEVPGWDPKPVVTALSKIGYGVAYELVEFAKYGVPTMRKRWIVIAVRGGGAGHVLEELRKMSERPPRPIDLIKDLPGEFKPEIDHVTYEIRSCIRGIIPYIPPGKALRDVAPNIPKELLTCVKDWSRKPTYWLYRVPLDGLVKVVPHPRRSMVLHPVLDRMLTVRELARLHTYPDEFTFKPLSVDEAMRAITDSVPPKFSQKLAAAVKKALL